MNSRAHTLLLVLLARTSCSAKTSSTSLPPRTRQAPTRRRQASAQRFSCAAQQWRLSKAISREVVISEKNSLLILGGETAGGRTVSTVERLDVTTGREAGAGALARATHDAGGGLIGGRATVFGGGDATSTALVQTLGSGIIGRLPRARSDLATATVNGATIIAGGYDGSRLLPQVLTTTDGRSFRVVARLVMAVRYPAVAAIGDTVYVVGGTDGVHDTSAIQSLNLATGVSRIVSHLPVALSHASAVRSGNEVLILGGRIDGRASARAFAFDASNQRVRVAGSLPYAVSDGGLAVVGTRAYLVGGETDHPLSSVIGCDIT